jgi:hypothetical protein
MYYLELPLAYFEVTEQKKKKLIVKLDDVKPVINPFDVITCEIYYQDSVKFLNSLPTIWKSLK